MALKTNVYSAEFVKFRDNMADMRHYQVFVEWQLRSAKKAVEKTLDVLEKQGHKNKFGAATSLNIVNVFHKSDSPWRAPSGVKRSTSGETIVPMATEMEHRFNGYILVASFERLEGYSKTLYGKMLYQLRNEITITDKKDFHKAQQGAAKHEGTPSYYLQYARFACKRDCSKAIAAFMKHLPWNTINYDLMYGMKFDELVKAFATCRHCIVHSEGRVDDDVWEKLDDNQATFVRYCLRESLMSGESAILPKKEIADKVVEALVSYGYALFVMLSERCGMEIDEELKFFPRPGDPKKKSNRPPPKMVTIHLDGRMTVEKAEEKKAEK